MKAVASTKLAVRNTEHSSTSNCGSRDYGQGTGASLSSVHTLQRKASCACGGGCPACLSKLPIQAKLSISEPGDIYEQEADRVADQVMAMPESSQQNDTSPAHNNGDGQVVQRKSLASTITPFTQRQSPEQVDDDEGATENKPDIQRFAAGDAEGGVVPDNFLSRLGPGRPLDPQTRSYFEPRFGSDFGSVRIYTDSLAAASARAVNAKAYTVGRNIVFGAGNYETDTTHGKQLIAHELTHVVQQENGVGSQIVTARRSSPQVARSVDEWLTGSVDISSWTYTQLVSEIDELTQYLSRQTSSSTETSQLEESVTQLRAEVDRRETAAAGSRPRARGRTRRRATGTPATSAVPLPTTYPRVLVEMTSVAYVDPAEMRTEYDLIMQWLARPDISVDERRIMSIERDNLAPQLTADRERVVSERHAERARLALTPTETGSATELVEFTQTILGIAIEPGNPSIAYIYHRGERIAISAEQAQMLRNSMQEQLSRASRRIESRLEYEWGRYTAQVELNDDYPVISSIAGLLGGVDDPGDDLYISYRTCMTRVHRIQRLIDAGSMLEAARLIPRAERIAAEVSDMSHQFYEGYIEGAGIAVSRLELTRDVSFAIAGSIAAVVAAPVVAGAVGVGGLGLTGAGATVATIAGTGMVVGTGMAGVRGTSAAGGILLAGGTLSEAGSTFTAEAWRGFREGFLSGAGGAAARSIGLAINAAGGSLATQVASRVGGEMLINGTTTMVDVLARGGSIEDAARAAVIAAAQAVPGALLGGSNNPVVRNLVAPFTASGTSYLAARANGASQEDALAQAGVALASNIAMSRAIHTPDADSALVERGRAIGAGTREAVVSTARRASPYAAAMMIGVADALPPVRSGFGSAPVIMDADSAPRSGSTTHTAPAVDTGIPVAPHPDLEVTPPSPIATVADAAPATPHVEADAPAVVPPVADTTPHAASTSPVATAVVPGVTAVDTSPTVVSAMPAHPAIADSEAFGAALTGELGMDAPGTHVPAGSRATRIADAHADAVAAGWVDSAGDPVPGGSVHAVVGEHGDASDRRSATGQTGATRESAHIGATSILRTLAGYSRRLAMTVLLPRATHQAFDQNWMRWIFNRRNAIRASGSTNFTATLNELLAAQRQALGQTPNLSPQTRSTLEGMLGDEFHNFASTLPQGMDTPVPLPRVWGS